jgi:hypothetical protein
MQFKIYCDLDGVLADFDRKVLELSGKTAKELDEQKRLWPLVAKHKDFFGSLDWMPDGKELWNAILPLNPTILTGMPMGNWAKDQKLRWCTRELGNEIPVITTYSREKHLHSGPNCVLIDDRIKLKDKWEEAGGIFIYHLYTANTLLMLTEIGII